MPKKTNEHEKGVFKELMKPIIHTITTPGLAIHTYCIQDPLTRQAVVIDPVRDATKVLDWIKVTGAKVKFILETHVHADFVSGAKELKDSLDQMPIICSSGMGGKDWIPQYAEKIVQDGENLEFGEFYVQALHTPGHTPEHISWILYDKHTNTPLAAFTGDFLFIGSVGRPDLLGDIALQELAKRLYQSIFHRLPQLPDDIEIYPAHGSGSLCGKQISKESHSTLGIQRKTNPFLQTSNESDWKAMLMKNMPKAPKYFQRMKKFNVSQLPLLRELTMPPKMELMQLTGLKNAWVIDTRKEDDFSMQCLRSSVNIPFGSSFSLWAAALIPFDQPLYLVVENPDVLSQVLLALRTVGLDNVAGYAIWDPHVLHRIVDHLDSVSVSTPEEVNNLKSKSPEKIMILDVRTCDEWNEEHIPGAIFSELSFLPENMNLIPRDKTIAVICGAGRRASTGASLLKREGYSDIHNVKGGMAAWKFHSLPTIQGDTYRA